MKFARPLLIVAPQGLVLLPRWRGTEVAASELPLAAAWLLLRPGSSRPQTLVVGPRGLDAVAGARACLSRISA
jgi:hypothetical protein